ncbi:MAG: DUF3365 domain-containing protein [Pseudomonadota bacterium]|nr:DUF3365 domain-containing protein [Pseudomonadota bacterium]
MRIFILALSAWAGAVLAATPPAEDLARLEQEARTISASFGKQLKGVLQATMLAGGPVEAIKVCHTSAPEIAQRLSREQGWTVARTSTRVRNPSNAADEWEQQILQQWQDKIERGAPVGKLEASTVLDRDGEQTFRYMRAIPTGEVCLNCHGSRLSPAVAEQIKLLYPNDAATGFQKGELRGAFSLEKSI